MSPWSIVIVLRTILFCVLANVVCGSQNYYYWGNARTRNPRYASCPTCHRDCPDSLSSPWYSRQRYDEVSNRRPTSFDGGSYVQWPPSNSRIHPRNEFGRSTRSGGSNLADVTAAGTGNSYRYGNPFEDRQQLRRIDPYLASKPPASLLNEGNALANSPYSPPFMPMTNSLVNRDYQRQSYQPRKYGMNSVDRSAYRENCRECSKDRSKVKLDENPYRDDGPIGASSVDFEKEENEGAQVKEEEEEEEEVDVDREEDYPKVSSEKYLVVYRADVDANSFEEPVEEDTSSLGRSDFAGVFKEPRIGSRSTDIDGGPFARVDRRSFLEGYSEGGEEFLDSRRHFGTSELIRESEIKRNSYNLSPKSNVEGMQNVQRDIHSDRDDEEWSDEEIDRSFESLTGDNDYYDTTIAKESTQNISEDRLNNRDEKLHDEGDNSKVTETMDREKEASLKFDPDLLDDIENPPVEPTEPTEPTEPSPTSLPTESTIATEDRR